MATARPPEFTLFSKLPTEIRLHIWQLCLPIRVFELDKPADCVVFNLDPEHLNAATPCSLAHTSVANARPPVIAAVCKEARDVAFQASILDTDRAREVLEYVGEEERGMRAAWSNLTKDVVHTNWWSKYTLDFSTYVDDLDVLSCNVRLLSSGVGSMVIGRLGYDWDGKQPWEEGFERLDGGIVDSMGDLPLLPLNETTTVEAVFLKLIPTWLVVIRVVIVHSGRESASGFDLFGVLGEAPVQIVEATDEHRMGKLYQFAEACEGMQAWPRQDFRRESAKSMQQRLAKMVTHKFGDEKLTASMHPAVMFRLCTQMCNLMQHGEECKKRCPHQLDERRRIMAHLTPKTCLLVRDVETGVRQCIPDI